MHRLLDNMERVVVVTGGFGSGKSEFALNLALAMAEKYSECNQFIALADLDIINPYFRTREASSLLEQHGIKAVVPLGDVFHSDLPVYGPGIVNLLRQKNVHLILDVGGDEKGATALASIAHEIVVQPHSVVMVVNPYRPFTRNVTETCRMAHGIENRSRLKIHALVSNPNLGYNTTAEVVVRGHRIVQAASKELQLPLAGLIVLRRFLELWGDQLVSETGDIPVVPIDIHLSPWWLQSKTR